MDEAPQSANRMTAMLRDPSTIFVYWNLGGEARDFLRKKVGEEAYRAALWMLRLTNLDTGRAQDVGVDPDAGNWYLKVDPDAMYETEIGLKSGSQFFRALSAAPVRVPPESYSAVYDRDWMVLEEDYKRLMQLGWDGFAGSSLASFALDREEQEAWVTAVRETESEDSEKPTSPGVPDYQGRK
jgi:hypothetical protein